MLRTAFFESPLYVHLSVFAEDAMGLVGVRRHCKCPYLEETCTPEPAFVYISTNEDDDYPEEEPISNKGSETHDDVADSEDLSKSNYNADSCEVVQDDDTVGSYSETVTVATVDGKDCNEDKSGDDSDDEQLFNATSFNWDNDFKLHDSVNDDTVGQTRNVGRSAITSTLVRIQLQVHRGPMRRYV
ncbi:hypothetical protein JRO89_XS13G0234500 [Xanthoceras sorbifolium]|uniref:Uncharacterized protein n=1 Tax=Xanthoceras sorbifolium TaxID=99658 RepID=A0ABQ8H9P4_9ROSI|nr:hypothetical protein JRO89_XS13G0234500 [Xanthoceras sorbifolium]